MAAETDLTLVECMKSVERTGVHVDAWCVPRAPHPQQTMTVMRIDRG
jgi:hypothetical protein